MKRTTETTERVYLYFKEDEVLKLVEAEVRARYPHLAKHTFDVDFDVSSGSFVRGVSVRATQTTTKDEDIE